MPTSLAAFLFFSAEPSAARLAPIDLAIVALYLVAITVFGLRFSRRGGKAKGRQDKSLKNYFLANNTIPWWAIALSIVSAETSTLTIISIPGIAFGGNFGFLQVVLGYMAGRIVVALLFLPKYFRGEMLTAYQLIERRFGSVLYKLTAGLFLLTRAAAEGVRVFAISIVVGIAIGTGDILSIGLISLLTLLYTFEGGLAAVIWTDVVQMALYLGGTLAAIYTLGHQIPGGWPHIHAVAGPLGKFRMLDFTLSLTKTYTFWAGLLGGCFLTMASHGTDQLMVQRMLAARNLRESRLALLSSGAVIFLQFSLFLLIGAGLFVFYEAHPQIFSSPDRIFPTFIVREMPRGVAGLLVAAILAAAMSNLSAALNSLASTTVIDFYLPFRTRHESSSPAVSDRERTFISRASTIFWALILFGIAVYSIRAGGKGHVVETGLSIASVAYGCLLGVFLLGTLTRFATQTGAILGMIGGLTVNLLLWLLPASRGLGVEVMTSQGPHVYSIPHVAWTWYVFIGSLVTFALGSLFSVVLRKRTIVAAVLLIVLATAAGATSFAQSANVGTSSEAQPSSSPQAMGEAPDFTPISTLITTAIAAHKLPGAVVLIGHNNRIVFHQAYGNRALEPTFEPMTEETIFDMASLTKVLVTTTAILQLEQAHKLDLDTPAARYLPAFAVNGKQFVTVRDLLTHYSGLPPDVDLKDTWGLAGPDKAEGIRRALSSALIYPPGIKFEYSDINFITLGALVETLSGQSLDEYARYHIFAPLHMLHTRYLPFVHICGYPALFGSAGELPKHSASESSAEMCNKVRNSSIPEDWLFSTAPTSRDDEGTGATNPNFNHILRGTVHDPTTRRMGGVAGQAGVFSTAADTAIFAQALLQKLLDDAGPFPLAQSSLRLMTRPQQPATAAADATIFTPDGQLTKGVATRGFGWDLNSAFSRPRGEIFPITTGDRSGSFGHTGFTGTSLWIDPVSNTYVILLTNAIHPRVSSSSVSVLRGEVATAAARALGISGVPEEKVCNQCADSVISPEEPLASAALAGLNARPTLTGIDVLEATRFAALHEAALRHGGHLRIGLLTNNSGLDARGRRSIDVLASDAHKTLPEVQLTKIFSPEHGLLARQDTEQLTSEDDAATHLPVISLYGPRLADKHPRPNDLADLDAIVIDLQDAGVRFWTYETLVGYFLEDTRCTRTEVIVLDRPNPIGGLAVQGPLSDAGVQAYTNFRSIPLRHGMTLGELARYFQSSLPTACVTPNVRPGGQPAALPEPHPAVTVISMQNWTRSEFFAETGLTWTPPSPNLRSTTAATLYPGIGLIEQTNLSVGRGTPAPFENIGAAYFRADELAAYLVARKIPGVQITPSSLTVSEDANRYPAHGQTVPAIHFEVTDRVRLDTPELGLELLSALHHLYPTQFQLDRVQALLANRETLEALKAGRDPREIAATWTARLAQFRALRLPYLLYR